MPVFSEKTLTEFANALLTAGGADKEEAETVSQSLVGANLRGHDSHGVMRIPFYLDRVKQGIIKPGSRITIEQDAPGAVVCSGEWGFGQVVARQVVERTMDKAVGMGIACGTLRQAAHIGRLGEYAEMAAAKNMTSIICANTHGAAQRVAPVGGKRPRLGTNPICIGMPGGKTGPFILDFGTSATAEGKVRVKKIGGQTVPDGWLLDPEGKPTNDPHQLYGDPPGTILPMGGDQAYKGFGLAFMVEMLSGVLSGGQCAYPEPPPPVGNCATFIIMDPQLFAGAKHLKSEVLNLEEYVRNVPRIEGAGDIILPGDPERNTYAKRKETGVTLEGGNWDALAALATELEVPIPAGDTTS